VYAGDEEKLKKSIIEKFTSGLSSSISNILDGEGDTKVQIDMGEDYHPEFSIVTVRPISKHHSNDATFIQLQLNEQKIRGDGRLSTNIGIGYRKLSDSKDSITGANVFVDYDEEGNTRASVGLELRSSSFELLANYYQAISGGQTVGTFTERTLDGTEISAIGQVPYLPWANVVASHYQWEANKNSKDSKGDKISLEMTLTPNFVAEVGYDDNNISGTNNFAKVMFVYPARETPTATTNFISDTAFVQIDMSSELLSIVRRSNKQIIESEGTGVVMARSN
tara:strand:- start:965 stop:1804 length:840 start_codon:yes stop_codon:yes gene_type:complete